MITLENIYGALGVIGIYIGARVIDVVAKHFIDRAIFGPFWNYIKQRVKILFTHAKPISVEFQFKIRTNPMPLNNIKTSIKNALEYVKEENKNRIKADPLTWNDKYGNVNLSFGKWTFKLSMSFLEDYELIGQNNNITNIAFSIDVNFPFSSLSNVVLDLSAITGFIRHAILREIPNAKFSKGTFVITPIKGELTLDQWIKKENFDVSMLLKSKEQILVDFYADKAKLTTPHLGIDSTIAQYLRAILLNYYLS
ncbi:MAG: hypothetical protein ACE5J3_12340 [Methanosarcinales archaeon]